MASGGSDRDAEYALSKLLKFGTVAEYEREAFALARITEARFEDERATTVIAKPNDLNIAVQVQDIEETTLHTSDKVEAVSTSMVATYEEHGCQDGFCMVATYEEQECQDGLKPVTTRSSARKKGDLGAITSKGGPPDHMRASEKELVVLKSPLEQKSMFRRQERMLRRQEQQRLAKDAKIQRRIWDPGIKSTIHHSYYSSKEIELLFMASDGSDQDARYTLSKLMQMGTVAEYESEFMVLANRVTGISESLLTSFYISGLKLTLQIDMLRARPKTLGEAFALARITKARFEDKRATTVLAKPNDLNIAVQVQDIEETILHTSDKVEAVSTSMVATYEEHGCQDEFCMVATYEEQECQDGLKPVTTRSSAGKKGDLGAITSKGGRPYHMRASEKELVVLKSPLEQKSMFRRQERMLRSQEQQRLAKDSKIQRRIWDPGIKSLQDNTLRERWF
ncbi:hypothetical protein Tco_0929845 [Tanacetum coccineum]